MAEPVVWGPDGSARSPRFNDIYRSIDVGFFDFEGVVLTDFNSFKGGSVNHNVNAIKSPPKAIPIANITNEKPKTSVIVKPPGHFGLF